MLWSFTAWIESPLPGLNLCRVWFDQAAFVQALNEHGMQVRGRVIAMEHITCCCCMDVDA